MKISTIKYINQNYYPTLKYDIYSLTVFNFHTVDTQALQQFEGPMSY